MLLLALELLETESAAARMPSLPGCQAAQGSLQLLTYAGYWTPKGLALDCAGGPHHGPGGPPLREHNDRCRQRGLRAHRLRHHV